MSEHIAALPDRNPNQSNEQQGLYRKFNVRRTDGSDSPGGRHDGCDYFVLDATHDPHAEAALIAYANAVEATHPALAQDMRDRYALDASAQPAPGPLSSATAAEYLRGKSERERDVRDTYIDLLEEALSPGQGQAVAIPPEIAAIIERLHTQDNRITANPLFAVQQRRRIYGVEEEYCERFVWVDDEGNEGDEDAPGLRRVGYIDKWEFVTGCLTEQGCKDYIACNGHNLNEPRIYAYGSYRNAEFIALREWLMGLREPAASPAPQEEDRIAELENEVAHVRQWYGSRLEILSAWAREHLTGEPQTTFFNIVANAQPHVSEEPEWFRAVIRKLASKAEQPAQEGVTDAQRQGGRE